MDSSPPPSPPLTAVAGGNILATVLNDSYHIENSDCTTSIRVNGRIFRIRMDPSYFSDDSPGIRARYLGFIAAYRELDKELDGMEEDDDDGKETTHHHNHDDDEDAGGENQSPGEVIDQFHEWLLAALQPVFSAVAPDLPPSFDPDAIRDGEATPVLSEYLFPREYEYRLEAAQDRPVTVQVIRGDDGHGGDCCCSSFDVPTESQIHEDLLGELRAAHVPFVDASELEVSFKWPEDALSATTPTRVVMAGPDGGRRTTCFFKRFRRGDDELLELELESYLKMLTAGLPPPDNDSGFRIIRLLAVVTAEADGMKMIPGILLTHVDAEYTCLLDRSYSPAPLPLRERWAAQLRRTVGVLHGAGVTWGDAKPENLVVDVEDDLWLVDFGGGRTEGWVDEGREDTVEGDLQGVERVVDFLINNWRGGDRAASDCMTDE